MIDRNHTFLDGVDLDTDKTSFCSQYIDDRATVLLLPVLHSDDWDLLYRVVAAMPGGAIIRRYWQRDIQITT